MFERLGRKRFGAVVCPNCGRLVGVNDEECLNCGRRNPGLWGFAPALRKWGINMRFDHIVLTTCVVLFLATLPSIRAPSGRAADEDALTEPVRGFPFRRERRDAGLRLHRWWTVLSAGVLHGGLLHLVFNMFFLRQIGPQISEFYGPSRGFLIFSLSSVVGFPPLVIGGSLSPPAGASFRRQWVTVGASAGLFGSLGLWSTTAVAPAMTRGQSAGLGLGGSGLPARLRVSGGRGSAPTTGLTSGVISAGGSRRAGSIRCGRSAAITICWRSRRSSPRWPRSSPRSSPAGLSGRTEASPPAGGSVRPGGDAGKVGTAAVPSMGCGPKLG